MGLSARREAILKTIVEDHVATGAPVGSAAVVRRVPFSTSSATVRNEMAALADEGYISQPHTSAGRIPEVGGYRYYVDHFAAADALSAGERCAVGTFFREVEAEVEHLLHATSRLLARMTNLAAVVVPPLLDDTTLASLHLTRLVHGRVLCVFVTRSGRVAKLMVEADTGTRSEDADEPLSDAVVSMAEEHLTKLLVGRRDWAKRWRSPEVADPEAAALVRNVLESLRGEESQNDVFLEGAVGLVERIAELDELREVLHVLDERRRLVRTLQEVEASSDTSPAVRIGTEFATEELSHMALVIASYRLGQTRGLVGLVGPMRIDYTRAMSAVSYVSAQLEQAVT